MKYIKIEVDELDDIKNIYNNNDLNNELEAYLLKKVKFEDKRINIEIHHTSRLSKDDKEGTILLIRRNYRELINELRTQQKWLLLRGSLLLILGVVLIALANSNIMSNLMTFSEIIDIAGLVCFWELIYSNLFRDINIIRDIRKARQIIKSKITFVKV